MGFLDFVRAGAFRVAGEKVGIDGEEGGAVGERGEDLLGPVRVVADGEGGGEGFDTVEPPGTAVVDCVCGNEVGY